MSSLDEVRALHERARDLDVLSVYLPGVADANGERDVRLLFEAGLSRLRLVLEQRSADERTAFEGAVGRVHVLMRPDGTPRAGGGCAIFATETTLLHVQPLADDDAALVIDWRRGCVLAPLVARFRHSRPVVALLFGANSATLYRFGGDGGCRGDVLEAARATTPGARARFLCAAADHAASLAGPSGWCVVSGESEAVRDLLSCLPNGMISRLQLLSGLTATSDESEVRDACITAATDLSRHRDALLLDHLLDRRQTGVCGLVGVQSVRDALDAGTVAELLISPRFIATALDHAEAMVRAALSCGAAIEVPEGESAERLDAAGEGVAARLCRPAMMARLTPLEAGTP